MSTSTIEKIGITATIVKPEDLRNLLLGALVAVCKDSSLPVLNGVQLTMKEGVLTASSTDRYRLITGTLGVLEVERGEDFTALIHRDDVKRIVNALKTTGDWPTVAVTPADRGLMIHFGDSTLSVRTLEGTFPDFEKLLPALLPEDSKPMTRFVCNLSYLAAFDAIPRSKETPTVFMFHGDNKPVEITVNCFPIQWRGLLMPMKG